MNPYGPAGTPGASHHVRAAEAGEIERLARLWHDGWHDAHARLVPAALTRVRTLDNFRERVAAAIDRFRVAGAAGAPLGLHLVRGDELYQLYVGAAARGTGVAAALIADAEAQLTAAGVTTAWLSCAIGNDRAARFYEKSGWRRAGTVMEHAEIPGGTFPLEVWRYEKKLVVRQP